MEDGPFLLLAEVESFFGLEYLRGVGLLGLRGGDTWWKGDERQVDHENSPWLFTGNCVQ